MEREKTLLVIGASSDMGMELLRTCNADYGHILAQYRTLSPEMEMLGQALGQRMTLIQADLADRASVESMLSRVREGGFLPDHIVHFAAPPCVNGHFHKLPSGNFEEALTIGLDSLIRVCQAFLPNMVRQKAGRIVVTLSSVVEGTPPPYCAHYVTTKYAMLGLVRALASEYASKGVTVNGVSPAWTDTKYIANQPDLLIEKYAADCPRGRLLQVAEIIPAMRYLLSDAAGAVSGQNLIINCGK